MANKSISAFRYLDLFAGVGGFAAAFNSFGGSYSAGAEIDGRAAAVYLATLGHDPSGSVQGLSARGSDLTDFEVLAGGFPCQPFSKSGAQLGTAEPRGTLFDHIETLVISKKPLVVFLENVRNLAGPKHIDEWNRIVDVLRSHGYRVSRIPAEFSPHLLPKELGGRPQHRVRLFITATLNPNQQGANLEEPMPAVTLKDFPPIQWDFVNDLPTETEVDDEYFINSAETECLEAWQTLIESWRKNSRENFPSFPLWTEYWHDRLPNNFSTMPEWKKKIVKRNVDLYQQHRPLLSKWIRSSQIRERYSPSKAKFEWQAGNMHSIWEGLIQFRPSGVRVKPATYVPTLVALNQTPIIGKFRRRITTLEAARLQGFPDGWHARIDQPKPATYKQLGNAVNIGVIAYVFRQHCERDSDILARTPRGRRLLAAVREAPLNPDKVFDSWGQNVLDAY